MFDRILLDIAIISVISLAIWIATDNTTIVYVKEKHKQIVETIEERKRPIYCVKTDCCSYCGDPANDKGFTK